MSFNQHYLFAHRLLPEVFAADPEGMLAMLRGDASGPMLEMWARCQQGKPMSSQGLAARLIERPGFTVGLVTMPPPQNSPEAYFIAMVFEPGPPRYLVLEKGARGTIVGQWNPRGNLGEGPPPEVDQFLARVHDLASNPQELHTVNIDPEQLEVKPGEMQRYLEASPANLLRLTPEKLMALHCILLLVGREQWGTPLHRASQASWWSFRFKKKVNDMACCLVLSMMYSRLYQQDPLKATAGLMGACALCQHYFPHVDPQWENHPDELTPRTVAELMASRLSRPQRAAALEPFFEMHQKIIDDRLQGVVFS